MRGLVTAFEKKKKKIANQKMLLRGINGIIDK